MNKAFQSHWGTFRAFSKWADQLEIFLVSSTCKWFLSSLSLRCTARFLMNPENPPPYPGPGPTAPYPPYPQQPMGPMGAPPPQGYPYPPPQGYPYQGYPQYGWQGGPQEPPKTTGRCLWICKCACLGFTPQRERLRDSLAEKKSWYLCDFWLMFDAGGSEWLSLKMTYWPTCSLGEFS